MVASSGMTLEQTGLAQWNKEAIFLAEHFALQEVSKENGADLYQEHVPETRHGHREGQNE